MSISKGFKYMECSSWEQDIRLPWKRVVWDIAQGLKENGGDRKRVGSCIMPRSLIKLPKQDKILQGMNAAKKLII